MNPARGEIWMINLNPAKGREQAGIRPALIFSVNGFNESAADLIIVVPITSKMKEIPLHVRLEPHESGLRVESYVKCEDIRSISKSRLMEKVGSAPQNKMEEVEKKLKLLLGL
ncbi:MAG: type II toxin-antitoxin system PemK/MazF family toxin [Bacteroidetes bacterium]|nr:type II toxin-antitoxin system PemK/MazF family toxin [Bacteroidota bacterium]